MSAFMTSSVNPVPVMNEQKICYWRAGNCGGGYLCVAHPDDMFHRVSVLNDTDAHRGGADGEHADDVHEQIA